MNVAPSARLSSLLVALLTAVMTASCVSIIPSLVPHVDAEKDIKTQFPFRSKFVDVLASKMHYVDVGKGAPIVLLHGNPTSSYLWRNVIPHLAKTNRVIAVDLIGMGKSGKPDIPYRFDDHMRYFDAFMDAMRLKDVTFVLHDWGGAIGFDHAMRHPENTRAVAFMEALIHPIAWDEMSWPEAHLFRTMRSKDGDTLLMDENYFVEKLVPAFAGRPLGYEEMYAYRAPFKKVAHRKPVRLFPQEVPFDDKKPADNYKRMMATYNKIKTSKVPLLLLTADPGAIIKPEVAARFKKDMPRLKVQAVGAGIHYIQETQPTAIGKALVKWIGALPAWKGAVVAP